MTLSTAQLLAPQTIRKAISQLDLPGTSLQNLFGWGLGGATSPARPAAASRTTSSTSPANRDRPRAGPGEPSDQGRRR